METDESAKEYRWETGYEKTWESITEDRDGFLEVSVQEMLQRARRKRLLEKTGNKIKLGMMRHLYIILDMSDNMKLQDLKPSRLLCVLNLLEKFIEEFFHLNPISQIGLILTKNKRAELVSELAGNPRSHIEQIKKLAGKDGSGGAQAATQACSGEPSLQNSVELALQVYMYIFLQPKKDTEKSQFREKICSLFQKYYLSLTSFSYQVIFVYLFTYHCFVADITTYARTCHERSPSPHGQLDHL
jgi:hypothetical protein